MSAERRNSYFLFFISWHISRRKVWPWFWPQGHVRSNLTVPIESPRVLHMSASRGSNLVFVTVFETFRITGFWRWPLTSQGNPKWSLWTLNIISVGSNIITLGVLDIFCVKYDLNFWPIKVIRGQIWRCQSKARGSYICAPWGSNLVSVGVFETFRIKGFSRWPLTPQGHPRSNLMVPIESP